MFKSYLKTSWRHLLRNKTIAVINIAGLSLGMAFAVLIGMWIHFERNVDTFHANKDRIALVGKHIITNGRKSTGFNIMLPLYHELQHNYPEIKRVSRVDHGNNHSLVAGEKKLSRPGHYVDPDFLQIFSFPLVKGSSTQALHNPNSIILTESLAAALFGHDDPLGKTLQLDNSFHVQVTGVMKDVPENSSFNFEYLIPYAFLVQNDPDVKASETWWGNSFLNMVVEIREGASMDAVSARLQPLLKSKDEHIQSQHLFLFPIRQLHLYGDFENWQNTGGRIMYVKLFGIVGGIVLLIACINFVTLSTARSEKRAMEVGVRKAIGSARRQLIGQFLTESLLTVFLAFAGAMVLVPLILPSLRDVGFENIRFDLRDTRLWGTVLIVCLATGLLAGGYPAFYLSSFLPVKALKGRVTQGKRTVGFRKLLVVSQFAISIGLIISTVVVVQQIRHARNRPVHYNPDNLVQLSASKDLAKNYDALKRDLLNTGYIEAVAKSSSPMTAVYNDWLGFNWAGKDPNATISVDVVQTGWDYEKAAGLEFVEGRPFSPAFRTDSNAVIINEAMLKLIGYKDPIGKTIMNGEQPLTIIGVIRNVLMRNPFKPVGPGVIIFNPAAVSTILIRLKDPADLRQALAAVKPVVERYNPAYPFEYKFVDEEFARKFRTENQVAKLAGIFAGLAIFISCLGLFGLTLFMVERRAKEISIRKALGASVTNLLVLLSREFIWMVVIALLIASPLAWWCMSRWLQQYEFRVEMQWWTFAAAGALTIFIALVTVSSQAVWAALENPVKKLRSE